MSHFVSEFHLSQLLFISFPWHWLASLRGTFFFTAEIDCFHFWRYRSASIRREMASLFRSGWAHGHLSFDKRQNPPYWCQRHTSTRFQSPDLWRWCESYESRHWSVVRHVTKSSSHSNCSTNVARGIIHQVDWVIYETRPFLFIFLQVKDPRNVNICWNFWNVGVAKRWPFKCRFNGKRSLNDGGGGSHR